MDAKGKRSGDSDYVEVPRPFIYSTPVTAAPAGKPYSYQVKAIRSIGDLTSRLDAKPKPGPDFWKIEPLKFALNQKPAWMSIDAKTGLITGTPDGGRNELSLKNEFSVLVSRVTPPPAFPELSPGSQNWIEQLQKESKP